MDRNQLTSRQKLGQLIVAGFKGFSMSADFVELVKDYKVGNVILFSYNVQSRAQLMKLCGDIQALVIQETGYPAFITMDQEGGVVTRLPNDSIHIPAAMAVAATEDSHNAYKASYIVGRELRNLGVNFNLAPDVDINNNPKNPVIGVRSYGETPEIVSEYGVAAIRGYDEANIMCLAKHFPGHGDTRMDSHLSLPCITKTYEELSSMELLPFKAAIAAGVPAIMTAHILYPELDNEVPVTMSKKIVTGILRQQLGFKGLVVSDCLEMNAIKEIYTIEIGAQQAIAAGVDLIFISHTAEAVKSVIDVLNKSMLAGDIGQERINEAFERIIYYKKKYAAPDTDKLSGSMMTDDLKLEKQHELEQGKLFGRELLEKSIMPVNFQRQQIPPLGNNPLFIGCRKYRGSNAASSVDEGLSFARCMGKVFGGDSIDFTICPDDKEIDEIVSQTPTRTCLIVGTYNGYLNRGQIQLVFRITRQQIPVIMVALGLPYDLNEIPGEVYKIAAYEYSQMSLEVVSEYFRSLQS